MAEMKERQEREDDERLKGLTPKERDEWKRSKSKPTGTCSTNTGVNS
jgi:hypothetical protein